ncbi:MAG: hypothetical protein V1780_04175 [Chloroflexota bacterium]
MFWKKAPKAEAGTPAAPEAEKLPGPREIPEAIGRYLVTEKRQDPDWVWHLKAVLRKSPQNGKEAYDFRIFDAAKVAAQKIKVQDYNSLDGHPELVLFQGWFDRKSMRVTIVEKTAA